MITGLGLLNEIEDRLGWRQTETIERDLEKRTRKLLRMLNRVLKTVPAADNWPLLRTTGTLLTQAPTDQSILVDLTNGSTTVTVSSYEAARAAAAGESLFEFETKHKEWAIQFGTNSPIYRIEKVVLPNEITLNRAWVGTSAAPTSASDDTTQMVLAMDRYTLPEDFDRPSGSWKDFLSTYNVQPVGAEKFAEKRRSRGSNIRYGDPDIYTVYGLDPSSTYQVIHFDPWPDQTTMMEYNYQRTHPEIEVDADRILFPASNIALVIEAVLYLAKRDYEDDVSMQEVLAEFVRQFNTIQGQSKVTDDRKLITPGMRQRGYSLRQRRGRGVRYDYGDHFDRVDMIELE